MRRPPTPKNTRNGLKWRDGRPRWEPSPASRAIGLRGLDLKDLEGRWLAERGEAIAVCDARQLWAQMIRDAQAGGPRGEEAAAELRAALERLQTPQEPSQRQRRALVHDLLDVAQVLLTGQAVAGGTPMRGGVRTVERLMDAYFDAVDRGELVITAATRRAYSAQRKRLEAKFAGRGVASISRAELRDWYHQDLKVSLSPSTANLCMGAAGAFFAFAWNKEWISASPVVKLGMTKAKGRRVFWDLVEERAFAAWCDEHGFEDVADGAIAGLWTGARLVDVTKANLEDLAGDVWRFTPQKTEKGGQEAMPGITSPFRARIDRRRREAASGVLVGLNATPFLWHPRLQRRHTTKSYWERFVEAKAKALADKAVPDSFTGKRHQDTRDTCITRLSEAGVELTRMWTWTGHSQDGIQEILKEHYIVLRQAGQREMAAKLEAWAAKEGVALDG